MFTNNTLLIQLASVSALLLAVGCSDGDGRSDNGVATQQGLLALDATVSISDPSVCIVTTRAIRNGAEAAEGISQRWRSYDESQRILSDVAVDAQGRRLAPGAGLSNSSYLRLSDAGRTLVHALELGGGELERTDYARDSHGNSMSVRQARTRRRELTASMTETPLDAHDYLNKYDPSGLLLSHSRTDSSWTVHYTHDESGRCSSIADDERIERREFDDQGRLRLQTFEPAPEVVAADPTALLGSVSITHRYDEQGRPLALEQDGSLERALQSDGQADVQTLWSYAADGSVRIERIDFTSQAPNDELEQDGAQRSAAHSVEVWSSACAALDTLVPAPQGSACSAD
jgi:hypothetical protein